MSTELVQISFNGKQHQITRDSDGLVSLTDLWRASGLDVTRKPTQWLHTDAAIAFVAAVAKKLKVEKSTVHKSRPGRYLGGSWAHVQIALAYAQWLSPDFHMVVNDAFLAYMEEERNPGLKMERAVAKFASLGKSMDWIEGRFRGVQSHHGLEKVLATHGGAGFAEIAICNHGNRAVLGKTAAEFKAAAGLPARAQTRDHLELPELTALAFFEAMTAKRIEQDELYGTANCIAVGRVVADVVADAVFALSGPLSLEAPEAEEEAVEETLIEEEAVLINVNAAAPDAAPVEPLTEPTVIGAGYLSPGTRIDLVVEDDSSADTPTEAPVPAPLPDEPEFNEETLQALRDVDAGRGVRHYSSVQEMLLALKSEYDEDAVGADREAPAEAVAQAEPEADIVPLSDEAMEELAMLALAADASAPKTPKVEEPAKFKISQVLNAVRKAWR